MKKLIIILTFFLFLINNSSIAEPIGTVSKDYKVVTKDGFSIIANLEYPKIKDKKEFQTVVLLHSMGYSSQWWETLPDELLGKGYAVLKIDLRGHGKSVYNSKLVRISWKNLTNNAFKKYPSDIVSVIDYVKDENKRVFFNSWAIVGSDIGANTAVLAANNIDNKPKTIVLLSPTIGSRGLYIPVKLAELSDVDFLSISGTDDKSGLGTQEYLEKFAQSTFARYISESKSTGMMLLKNDKSLSKFITVWISDYLK